MCFTCSNPNNSIETMYAVVLNCGEGGQSQVPNYEGYQCVGPLNHVVKGPWSSMPIALITVGVYPTILQNLQG